MTTSAIAPGRVNLIGDHTDYTGGLVLPMAIDLATTVTGEAGGDRIVLRSADEAEPAVVALDDDRPGSVEPAWARYVAAIVAEVRPATGFAGTGPLRLLREPGDVDSITDPMLRRRARHVVSENGRVRAFAEALDAGDVVAAGRLVAESHASLAGDLEVSTPSVDALVSRLAATPGVHGARMTGGGFGGCVVALTEPGLLCEGWTVQAAPGARRFS